METLQQMGVLVVGNDLNKKGLCAKSAHQVKMETNTLLTFSSGFYHQ